MTKVRQYFYLVSGALAGLLPILMVLNVVNSDQAVSLTQAVTALGGLIGAGGALTAGVVVGKQVKTGALDAPEVSAVDQAISAIPVVVQQAADAKANLEKLRQVATDAIGSIPVYGDEARAIINSLPRF